MISRGEHNNRVSGLLLRLVLTTKHTIHCGISVNYDVDKPIMLRAYVCYARDFVCMPIFRFGIIEVGQKVVFRFFRQVATHSKVDKYDTRNT